MKKEDELVKQLTEMIKDTKSGKITWNIECQTTEYNDPATKPVVEEEGMKWKVDECYVSYHCEYKNKEFLMISYEMIHQCDSKLKSTNLIFLPPLGIRFFDIHTLLPYSVEASQLLTYHVHMLWQTILDLYKKESKNINLSISDRTLTIDDEV